jgi:hypothetical protein
MIAWVSLAVSVLALGVSVIAVAMNNKNAKLPYKKKIDFVFMPKFDGEFATGVTCVINNVGNKIYTFTSCFLTGDEMADFFKTVRDNGDELEFPRPIEIDCSCVFNIDVRDFYEKVVAFIKKHPTTKLVLPIAITVMDFVYHKSNFTIGLTYADVLNFKFKTQTPAGKNVGHRK